MAISQNDAKALIYESLLHRKAGLSPEETPAIFDEATIEKPWGWIFFYNNERFLRTRDFKDQWVGQGPIFFNRDSGEIREFGSGCDLDREVYDYEMELTARDGCWCLWLTSDQEHKHTLAKLKNAFAITSKQALTMVPALPHCLFSGVRRELEWVAQHLSKCGVATKITLESSRQSMQPVFILPKWMINPSLAQAYHERWDVT